MGLHRRYSGILGEPGTVMTLADENAIDKKLLAKLRERFSRMMSALFKEKGAELRIEILNEPEITDFIDTHTEILSSPLQESGMSELMKTRLTESNYIFSGIKTFHELNEAFPSLLDEKGKRKPFEQFLNDVQKIDKTYNGNYLRAEYNFAQASAGMAEKWEQFTEDGDDYLLQYRTANDSKVRPEHAGLHGITLPSEDNFWDEYFPPNGWNCRCTVVQVLKSRYEQTPHNEAMERGQQVLQTDKQKMFRFNPGKTGSSFPAHNPYTISRCTTCDLAKLNLASGVTDNELCVACQMVNAQLVDNFGASRRIEKYDEKEWERTYISPRNNGLVVTQHERIRESKAHENEIEKFNKEMRMCKVIADNGHDVEYLQGENRPIGQTYDIRIDGIKADLKCITGRGSSIVKYARTALTYQGGEAVIFELPNPNEELFEKLAEARRKNTGKIYFYIRGEEVLKEVK